MAAKIAERNTQIANHRKVYNMSAISDVLMRRAELGARVRLIREALGMTGEEFGAALTRAGKDFGVSLRYDSAKISKIERGGRELSPEEAAILTMLDPEARGFPWLIFGDIAKMASKKMFKKVLG